MSDADAQLQELRPASFAIAYRMLGSVTEAEDVVQESLLRFHRARAEGRRIDWTRMRKRFIGAGSIRRAEINGQPGGFLVVGDALVGVWSLDIADGAIYGIRSIVNPDKLRHLGEVIDLNEFLANRARETTPAPGSGAGPGAG